MKELKGRVAVITGGASGIGYGMAKAFAGEGMKLVLADIETEPLERAVRELADLGAAVIGVSCDVSNAPSVDALRDRALSEFGAVHVVCNNAGVASTGGSATWEASLEDWSWVMGVNLMGVVHGIRSFVPVMIEQGDGGHVVNTASVAGLVPGMGIYGVTKHAVVALSESLFSELEGRGHSIGVSVLCPGWVNTQILESERNRPETPRADPGARAAEVEATRKLVEGLIRQGLDPVAVGKLVAESIRADRFYVLTHPHWKNMIQHRMENILEGRDPTGVPPADAGEEWSTLLEQQWRPAETK